MGTPSVRLLSAAVWALLEGHPHLVAFQSEAVAPPVDSSGSLTAGYAVLHAGGGNDTPMNLAMAPDALLWGFQVSCVGEDLDQVGWVVDEVRGLLTGKTLTVTGHVVGRMVPPLGFEAPPPRPQHGAEPPRLSVPLLYRVLAAA